MAIFDQENKSIVIKVWLQSGNEYEIRKTKFGNTGIYKGSAWDLPEGQTDVIVEIVV